MRVGLTRCRTQSRDRRQRSDFLQRSQRGLGQTVRGEVASQVAVRRSSPSTMSGPGRRSGHGPPAEYLTASDRRRCRAAHGVLHAGPQGRRSRHHAGRRYPPPDLVGPAWCWPICCLLVAIVTVIGVLDGRASALQALPFIGTPFGLGLLFNLWYWGWNGVYADEHGLIEVIRGRDRRTVAWDDILSASYLAGSFMWGMATRACQGHRSIGTSGPTPPKTSSSGCRSWTSSGSTNRTTSPAGEGSTDGHGAGRHVATAGVLSRLRRSLAGELERCPLGPAGVAQHGSVLVAGHLHEVLAALTRGVVHTGLVGPVHGIDHVDP
jgi:hypothetical protein